MFENFVQYDFTNIFWPMALFPMWIRIITCLIAFATMLLLLRAVYLCYTIITTENFISTQSTFKILICIGSGGHTTEMIELINHLNATKYRPRVYVLADNDYTSEEKILEFENGAWDYVITKIPRSRNVNQSYLSSIFSTIHSTVRAVPIIYNHRAGTILCNGPGMCIPVCAVAFLFRCLFMLNCRIVFVESVCRVRSLSLSGTILQFFADSFIVQWPDLRDKCFRAKYYGRLT